MPAKDRYHEPFVRTLEKDGWVITDDPLTLALFGTDLLIDLGAERVLAAEGGGRRIAIGVKSFLKPSAVQDLNEATGQFVLYEQALKRIPANADRLLYLAVPGTAYLTVFEGGIGRILLEDDFLRLNSLQRGSGVNHAMDTIERYREAIESVLCPYTAHRYSGADITNEAVFDRAGDHYLIVSVGWQGYRRVAHNLLHLDIIEGKVWIQKDGTEDGIAGNWRRRASPGTTSCRPSATPKTGR